MGNLPIWALVLGCGAVTQLLKVLLYSLANRRFHPAVVAQGYGLPSLQAALLGSLLGLVVIREGWYSGTTGFALVFGVVVVHDTLKLGSAASAQREVVYRLVETLEDVGPLHRQVARYLDPLRHHPAHVALGVSFGGLFALAFGLAAH